ncbi:hypothetical protein vBYenSP400_66 [Yersinia phage vB_YenS_P400]|nr:hypothetical protein vBYenSP400_66 [Yersinia phage vB_YenS_P400]
MAYGAQIFMDSGAAFDVVNSFLPAYIIDYFQVNAGSGSKSYAIPQGKTLTAKYSFPRPILIQSGVVTLSISGGTLSWNTFTPTTIYVWAG